jgi:hypothetical protein
LILGTHFDFQIQVIVIEGPVSRNGTGNIC